MLFFFNLHNFINGRAISFIVAAASTTSFVVSRKLVPVPVVVALYCLRQLFDFFYNLLPFISISFNESSPSFDVFWTSHNEAGMHNWFFPYFFPLLPVFSLETSRRLKVPLPLISVYEQGWKSVISFFYCPLGSTYFSMIQTKIKCVNFNV